MEKRNEEGRLGRENVRPSTLHCLIDNFHKEQL